MLHGASYSVNDIREIQKIAEVVATIEKNKNKSSSSDSSNEGDSNDTVSNTEETSTVINAKCSCFCTIKDALFKFFRKR